MSAAPTVSFSVNVCNADAPYLGPTLRHMMRQLDFAFCERIVTYDPGRQTGKYSERIQGTQREIESILDGLLADGVIDRIDEVPWTDEAQDRVLQRYFGAQQIDLKDFTGAPIYQYLYALDACRGEYVFHVDSDMLFHRAGPESWIAEGLAVLQAQPRVVVATPKGGPPQARNWLERLTRRSFEARPASPWSVATFTSTRYFLMDVAKFRACLPLQQAKPGEPLEDSLSHTFKLRGYERWTMTGYDHWAIHPWKHDENYIAHLDDLIWAVENGVYPFRRTGFRWDMRTEGRLIDEWLVELRRHGRGIG